MLILTRKVGESIVIGGGIEVRILDQHDGNVRVGIDAPKKISVLREELLPHFKSKCIGNNNS